MSFQSPGVSSGKCGSCDATVLVDDDGALQLHRPGCPWEHTPEQLCLTCGYPLGSVLHLANVCGRGQS